MAAVYLGTLLAIMFGIQHTLGKVIDQNSCGLWARRSKEAVNLGETLEISYTPTSNIMKSTDPQYVQWITVTNSTCPAPRGCDVANVSGVYNIRLNPSNHEYVLSIVMRPDYDVTGRYRLQCTNRTTNKYTSYINVTVPAIDKNSCGLWIRKTLNDVRIGETLELSYTPTMNIITSSDPQYVQWITVTNSTCPAPQGCDVANVSGVYNIRLNPSNHEYVLSIAMRPDYNVTGRYRLQCTNRTTNKYTSYINVTVPAIDKNSCGLWIRKTLNDVRIGETLELSYTPTKNIMTSSDPVYVQWITVTNSTCPAPRGCDVVNVSGVYNIRHNPSNHEYVLSIVMRPDYDVTGRYRLQCTNRTTDVKYTDYINVTGPVRPDDPVLQEKQTISGYDNCLVGTLGKNMQVQCRVSGGTEPLEVRIYVGNESMTTSLEASGLHTTSVNVTEQIHMAEVKCFVSNLALITPLVTEARIYVAVEPRGFLFPDTEAKAGMPWTFPYCTSGGARPPSNVTLRVKSVTVETNTSTITDDGRYITTARALSMRRAWNGQLITCCVDHITFDSPMCDKKKSVVYKFPPKSVSISPRYNYTELEPFYKYTAVCTILRASPVCKAVWDLPADVIKLDEETHHNLDGPGNAYTTVANMDLNVSRHDNGKLVTCTAKCTDFETDEPVKHAINVPDASITFNASSPMLNLTVGDSIVIECSAPWAAAVLWLDSESDSGAAVTVRDCGTAASCLWLENVNTKDGGRYTCTAQNDLYNVSEYIDVTVQGLVSVKDSSLGTSSTNTDIYMLLAIVLGCCVVLAVAIIIVVVLKRRTAQRKSDMQGAASGIREERQNNAEGNVYQNSANLGGAPPPSQPEAARDREQGATNDGAPRELVYADLDLERPGTSTSTPTSNDVRGRGTETEYVDIDFSKNVAKHTVPSTSQSQGQGPSQGQGQSPNQCQGPSRPDQAAGTQNELVYAELDLEGPRAGAGKGATGSGASKPTPHVVIGAGTETEYVDIDFSKKAPPQAPVAQPTTGGSGDDQSEHIYMNK